MQRPTKSDVDRHRADIEASFKNFAIELIVRATRNQKIPAEMLIHGEMLLRMMEEVAMMYSRVPHKPGTFVFLVSEVEKYLSMTHAQRLVDAHEMRGYLHIGAGGPVECDMRSAVRQTESLGLDFFLVDPMDIAMSDDLYNDITTTASKIIGQKVDIDWFERQMGVQHG